MKDKIEILIVDDHMLIREGLRKLISEQRDMMVVAECASGFEALKQLADHSCDIVILDINLPDRSGIDILQDIKTLYPKQRVLILSMYPEESYALRAIREGADGYLEKKAAAEELILAIRRIASGARYISETSADLLADDISGLRSKSGHEILSTREFQVLQLIGEGKSAQEISDRLSIGLSAINTYRARILEKLNLKSSRDLIKYAIEHRLVD